MSILLTYSHPFPLVIALRIYCFINATASAKQPVKPNMLYNLFPCKPGGGSPRKKGPKSAAPSKTHMPSVKTAQQDEVS